LRGNFTKYIHNRCYECLPLKAWGRWRRCRGNGCDEVLGPCRCQTCGWSSQADARPVSRLSPDSHLKQMQNGQDQTERHHHL